MRTPTADETMLALCEVATRHVCNFVTRSTAKTHAHHLVQRAKDAGTWDEVHDRLLVAHPQTFETLRRLGVFY